MFELTISLTTNKQHYINKLFKQLEPEVKRCSGIVLKQNYAGRCYFSFAVENFHKEYFKAKILDFVVFVVGDDYKYNFYLDSLKGESSNLLFESFLKAISIFDADADREIVKSLIDFSGEILIDSFYYFKLQMLRNRWQKTADIINANKILSNKSAMLDVLKYLTTMSDNLVVKTDVNITSKQIRLKNYAFTKCFKKTEAGQSDFLAEIVTLNPSKINLKLSESEDEQNSQIVNVLSELFTDKIYLLT